MAATLPLPPTDLAPADPGLRRLAWAVLAVGVPATAGFAALLVLAHAPRRGSVAAAATPARSPAPVGLVAAEPPPVPTPLPPAMAGSTGTIDLPALPAAITAGVMPSPTNSGVVAAAPFRFNQAGRADRGRALQCLTAAVYYEAASEPDAGQQAVAQVVLNRARHPAFPGTICGVVFQGSEARGCQFSFACDGAMTRHLPSPAGWTRATRVAAAALAGRVFAPVGLATHYHTYAVVPSWNRALVMTDAVGAHLFHRWKGWWGTAAAFSRHYAGGEPEPGPHSSLRTADPLAPAAAPLVAAAASPVTPAATVLPAYRASGTALVAPDDSHLPPASTILPRWRDSGRPLR